MTLKCLSVCRHLKHTRARLDRRNATHHDFCVVHRPLHGVVKAHIRVELVDVARQPRERRLGRLAPRLFRIKGCLYMHERSPRLTTNQSCLSQSETAQQLLVPSQHHSIPLESGRRLTSLWCTFRASSAASIARQSVLEMLSSSRTVSTPGATCPATSRRFIDSHRATASRAR